MSLLSLIAIHIKLHSAIGAEHLQLFRPHRKLEQEDSGTGGTEGSNAPSVAGEEVMDCICGVRTTANNYQELEESSTDSFLMDCDDCHTWFHGGEPSLPLCRCRASVPRVLGSLTCWLVCAVCVCSLQPVWAFRQETCRAIGTAVDASFEWRSAI
jgi:hypothetical protein